MADTSELLGNLADRRTTMCASRKRVQDQIDALVEGIANRRTALKSVSEKIVELEEQKEQLEDEILEVGMEIETAKQKAVSAQSLTDSLTTFGDLYREALPEERRELIRLRVNQLIWTPDEIRFTLLDQPEACQELVESQQLVAQRLDSLNHPASGISSIYQGHRRNTAFIGIGRRHRPRRLKVHNHPNALTQALYNRELLESGQADSQGELSRLCGTPHHDFGLPASPRVGWGGPCRGPEPVGRGREGRQAHRTPSQTPRGPPASRATEAVEAEARRLPPDRPGVHEHRSVSGSG
jgi:hypothetical protein